MEYLMNLKFTNSAWVVLFPISLFIVNIIVLYTNVWINRKISYLEIRINLGKKIGESCYILVGILLKFAFGLDYIMFFIVMYVCFLELISIVENCSQLGVPIPKYIQKILNNSKNKY